MPFLLPENIFDHHEHAKNKILRANQLESLIVAQFKETYEDFWGVSGSDVTELIEGESVTAYRSNGSRYSTAEMQLILESMPMTTAIDILTDAGKLVQYIVSAYPDSLPERYFTAAFAYTLDETGLHLTNIGPAWAKFEPVIEE